MLRSVRLRWRSHEHMCASAAVVSEVTLDVVRSMRSRWKTTFAPQYCVPLVLPRSEAGISLLGWGACDRGDALECGFHFGAYRSRQAAYCVTPAYK